MLNPIDASMPVTAYRQRPIPEEPPTAAEATDKAIAKYELDVKNGASPSDLADDRVAIEKAVEVEVQLQILQLPGREKTQREPTVAQLVDQFGKAIMDRHADDPAATRELVQGAIDDYKTTATQWTPEDRGKVDAYIKGAMDRHPGNIQAAFEELRDLRWTPGHFYDTNLAIGADYLRARWETEKSNNIVGGIMVDVYLDKKQNNQIPQNGPGPVSPYSELQKEYMHKGVEDQWNTLNWFEKSFLSDNSVTISGLARAAFENDVS
ncbi:MULTISPECIES: hypothetical protein [Lysobacter]|uniref:hypothetical protein n=2 Tax=Lysobacteraceae TaxID=32033 RepID=UPI001F1736C7|nr:MULTISPECIES: hypothetical protein [Lysobacter]UJB17354.1 hypothetical protein L1A79_13235 [Lysobacter capsici]UJQ28923.1 hypothetical protein L2D09_01630 [Lysobacter gummosus]